MADQVSATGSYEGDTNRRADVNAAGDCAGFFDDDNVNVVDFGDLPSGLVGKACWWYVSQPGYNDLLNADIRLNRADHDWTVYPNAPNCSGDYDIESVMTHERGHTYGLGHVSEAEHGRLTMSPKLTPCSDAPRTLGRGDVLGLRELY